MNQLANKYFKTRSVLSTNNTVLQLHTSTSPTQSGAAHNCMPLHYVPGTPNDTRSGFSSILRFPTVSVFPPITTLFIRRPSGHACSLETLTAFDRNAISRWFSDWEGLAPCRRRSSQLSSWLKAGKFRKERQDYNANSKLSLSLPLSLFLPRLFGTNKWRHVSSKLIKQGKP